MNITVYVKVGSFLIAIRAHHELSDSIRKFFLPFTIVKTVKNPHIIITVSRSNDRIQVQCGSEKENFPPTEFYLFYLKWKIYEQIILSLNDFIHFHCAAVMKNKTVILFPGNYGHGKTTMSLFLMHYGFKILNDDAAIIHPKTHEFYVLPKVVSARASGLNRLNKIGKIYEKKALKSGGKFLLNDLIKPRLYGPYKVKSYKCVFFNKKLEGGVAFKPMLVSQGWKELDKHLVYMPKTDEPWRNYLHLVEKIEFFKLSFSNLKQTLKYFNEMTRTPALLKKKCGL